MLNIPIPTPQETATFTPPETQAPYLLAFHDDTDVTPGPNQTLVRGRDVDDIRLNRELLNSTCEIYISASYGRSNLAKARAISRLRDQPYRANKVDDASQVQGCLRNIPLAHPTRLYPSLALRDDDSLPVAIDRSYVHKKKSPMS